MSKNKQKLQIYLTIGLGLSFVFGTALSLFVMYEAGCAGDVKSGSHADLIRSLELENIGFFLLLFSAVCGGGAIILTSKSKYCATHGIAFALLSFFCLWFLGVQFEVWGVKSCFN